MTPLPSAVNARDYWHMLIKKLIIVLLKKINLHAVNALCIVIPEKIARRSGK
jgi:hypothetical protein